MLATGLEMFTGIINLEMLGFLSFLILGPITLLISLIAVIPTLFWGWMLYDCLTEEPSTGNDKLIWVLVILFGTIFGAILYYFVRRSERIELYGE